MTERSPEWYRDEAQRHATLALLFQNATAKAHRMAAATMERAAWSVEWNRGGQIFQLLDSIIAAGEDREQARGGASDRGESPMREPDARREHSATPAPSSVPDERFQVLDEEAPSIAALCAAYLAARDAQLEYRCEHGGDAESLVDATRKAYDELYKGVTWLARFGSSPALRQPDAKTLSEEQRSEIELARQQFANSPRVKTLTDAARASSRITGEEYQRRVGGKVSRIIRAALSGTPETKP